MSERPSAAPRARNVVLLLLTLAAGCVDTIAYIALDVFPANMTGNTVLLGLALGRAEGVAVAHAALALAGFLAGAALGALIVARPAGASLWPRGASVALGVEWAVLAAFGGTWYAVGDLMPGETVTWLLIVASSLAMGLQSVIAVRLGVAGVTTTYVTGTLTTLTIQLVARARSAAAPHATPAGGPPQNDTSPLLAATWVMYVLGAAVAAVTLRHGPLIALGVPIVVLTLALILGATRLRGE